MEIENDPIINTDLDNPDVMVADTDFLKTDETSTQYSGRNAADSEVVGKRQSNRIKARVAGKNVSTLKVSKVHTAPSSGSSMGSSCSSQPAELKAKNKKL